MIKNWIAFIFTTTLLSPVCQAWQRNWLLGASAGYANIEGQLSIYLENITPTAGTLSDQRITARQFGETGGLLVGYQWSQYDFILGVELSVDGNNFHTHNSFYFTDNNNNLWAGSAFYVPRVMAALSGRFGYQATPYFMPYVRMGIEASHDTLEVIAVQGSTNTAIEASNKQTDYRFLVGLGAEMPFSLPFLFRSNENLTCRLEYNFHGLAKNIAAENIALSQNMALYSNTKPSAHSVKASLIWNFCTPSF